MANRTVRCNKSLVHSPGFLLPRTHNHLVSSSTSLIRGSGSDHIRPRTTTLFSARAGGVSVNSTFKGDKQILKRCQKCAGKGAIECPGCKGTGKNKKNGNIFERWKCFDCQGFGLKGCPNCGKGGLTPEQRGER